MKHVMYYAVPQAEFARIYSTLTVQSGLEKESPLAKRGWASYRAVDSPVEDGTTAYWVLRPDAPYPSLYPQMTADAEALGVELFYSAGVINLQRS